MSETYKVIGPCEVAGVSPGGTVTVEQLEKAGATNIPALIGVHLEQVADEPVAEAKPEEKAAPKKASK